MTSLIGGSPSQVPTNNQLARTAFIEPEDLPVPLSVEEELALKEDTIAAGTEAQYRRGDKQWADFETAVLNTNTGYPPFRPVFDANFLAAGQVDPRITFTRAGKSWRIVNGVLREYDVDEPVLTGDGLSLRPAETNLAAGDMTATGWAPIRSTLSLAGTYGPNNSIAEYEIGATNTTFGCWRNWLGGAPAGKYTWECIFRPGTVSEVRLTIYDGVNRFASFDLTGAGSVITSSNVSDASISRLADGRYHAKITATASNAITQCQVGFWQTNLSGTETFYASLPQFNAGDPIPPIPTTDSAVTRPADNTSIQDDAFASVWNPMEGAIVLDIELDQLPPTGLSKGIFRVASDQSAEYMQMRMLAGQGLKFFTQDSGGVPARPTPDQTLPGTLQKKNVVAVAYASDGTLSVFANGAKKLDGLLAAGNPQTLNLAYYGGSAAYTPPCVIRRLTIFNRRPTDSQMEALTS